MLNPRPLIDTPGRRRGAGYDFTPIGHARRGGGAASAASPTHRIPDPTQFSDVSFDLTHHDDTLEGVEAPFRLFSTQQQRSTGPLPSRFLKDGSGLVMDLQRRLQQLETENYNLKITVERLRRYLDSTPEEQLLLLDQNIELRQKVMQMAREAPVRRASAVSVGVSAASVASSPVLIRAESADRADRLEAELATANHQIEMLQTQVADARGLEPPASVVAELEAKTARLEADAREERLANEQLRHANDQLRRAVDDAHADKQLQSSEHSRISGERLALQAEIDRLQRVVDDRQDASASAIAAEQEAARTRGQLADAEREAARVREQLADAEREAARARDDLAAAHAELGRLRTLTPAVDIHAIQAELDTSLQRERELRERVAELQHQVSDARLAAASNSAAERQRVSDDRRRAAELEEAQARLQTEEASRRSAEQALEALRSQRDRSLDQQNAQHEEALELLRQERQRLRDQVLDLQQQLLTASGSDEVAAQLLQQVQDLTEKAYFYEDEYDRLEQAMEQLKRDLARDHESAVRKLDSAGRRVREAETTVTRLRLARDAAAREADAVQQAHARLLQEYEELQMQHARMARELELVRTQQPLWQQKQRELELAAQVERLLAETERMRSDVGVMVSEHKKTVAQLEQRLRDAQSAARTAALQEDLERLELVRARAAAESKVRQLQTDLDQAHQEFNRKLLEYEEQVKAVKQKETVKQEEPVPVRDGYAEQLERELERSAAVHREEVQRLERQVREAMADMHSARRSLEQERAAQPPVPPNTDRATLLEWESRYAEAKRELRRLENQYDTMREELLSKCRQLKDSKAIIADDLEVAQRQLARVKLEPKEEPMPAVDLQPWRDRLRLCELQLHYYKAVLYDANLRANDLAFANRFVVASIVGLSRIVGDAGSKLRAVGVYPERPRRVLFRGVALMVVAMVRIQNRGKRHAKRSQQLGELRREIVKAKTMLE